MPPRCASECAVPQCCRHAALGRPPSSSPLPNLAGDAASAAARAATAPRPPVAASHRCHFGACPPCSLPCGTTLACGHTCTSQTCHDAPPPAVAQFEKPSAPSVSALVQLLKEEQDQQQQRLCSPAGMSNAGRQQRGGDTGGSKSSGRANPSVGPSAVSRAVQMALSPDRPSPFSPCPPCNIPVQVSCLGRCVGADLSCQLIAIHTMVKLTALQ